MYLECAYHMHSIKPCHMSVTDNPFPWNDLGYMSMKKAKWHMPVKWHTTPCLEHEFLYVIIGGENPKKSIYIQIRNKPEKQKWELTSETETERLTFETVSRMGPISLQGPHQSAQNPTRTGRSERRTSSENLSCVMISTLQDVSMAVERSEREEKGRRGCFTFRSFDLLFMAYVRGKDKKEREDDVVEVEVAEEGKRKRRPWLWRWAAWRGLSRDVGITNGAEKQRDRETEHRQRTEQEEKKIREKMGRDLFNVVSQNRPRDFL